VDRQGWNGYSLSASCATPAVFVGVPLTLILIALILAALPVRRAY